MKKTVLRVSVLTVMVAATLLITGSEILVYPVSEALELPLGTISTWLGIVALPVALLSATNKLWLRQRFGKWYANALWFCVILSAFWGIISYWLSGKWNFTFSGSSPTYVGSAVAGEHFWILTKIAVAAPVLVFLAYLLHTLLVRINSSPK